MTIELIIFSGYPFYQAYTKINVNGEMVPWPPSAPLYPLDREISKGHGISYKLLTDISWVKLISGQYFIPKCRS